MFQSIAEAAAAVIRNRNHKAKHIKRQQTDKITNSTKRINTMLGVRSTNEPITGRYAEELMLKIVEMTLHPVKVDKKDIKFHFDWSEIDSEA